MTAQGPFAECAEFHGRHILKVDGKAWITVRFLSDGGNDSEESVSYFAEVLNAAFEKAISSRLGEMKEECCKAVCSYCRDGRPAEKTQEGPWTHRFNGTWEYCAAAAIRSIPDEDPPQ